MTNIVPLSEIAKPLPCHYGDECPDWAAGVPVAKVSNISSTGEFHRAFERRYFSDRQLMDLLVQKGDLLVVKSSGSKANILSGKTAYCDESVAGKLVASNFLMRLRVDHEKVSARYIWHVLNSSSSKDFVRRIAGTTTYPNLKWSTYSAHPIPLPPLEEQRRIAAILDKAHENKAKAAERTILISSLGRSLFVRRFGMPSENPHNLKIHRLVDICRPKQWPTISSKQLQAHGYPVFGANGLIGYFDRFNHSEPTVLVTCRGATCGTVNISPPNCYVTGNSMAMDDPDQSLLTTDYLAWVLRLRGMYDVISGSAQPQITRQGLEAVTIPVPPIEAQNEFSNELMAVSGMSESSQHTEDSLAELTNSLASELLGG